MKPSVRTFQKRKDNLIYLTEKTRDIRNIAHFVEEGPNETVSPHAFSITFKEGSGVDYGKIYEHLEKEGIQCKRNFGSMPTQHNAFKYLGHKLGDFPEAEYVGNNGLHFGIHQFLSKDKLDYASDILHKYLEKK